MESALRSQPGTTTPLVQTPAPTPTRGLVRFLQLFSVLQRSKSGVCGIFAFTSAARREGVSYVTSALAGELAQLPKERILLAQASVLSSMTARDLEDGSGALREVAPHLWSASAAPMLVRHAAPDLQPELVEALRRKFTYVLIDCRALRTSPEVLRIGAQVDGVLLVVGASESSREQVLQAQKVLQLSSDRLLGCVLNKQKHRIPGFFSRFLKTNEGDEK